MNQPLAESYQHQRNHFSEKITAAPFRWELQFSCMALIMSTQANPIYD